MLKDWGLEWCSITQWTGWSLLPWWLITLLRYCKPQCVGGHQHRICTLRPKPDAYSWHRRGSITKRNRAGDTTDPCFTPLSTRKLWDSMPSNLTWQGTLSYQFFRSLHILPLTPALNSFSCGVLNLWLSLAANTLSRSFLSIISLILQHAIWLSHSTL